MNYFNPMISTKLYVERLHGDILSEFILFSIILRKLSLIQKWHLLLLQIIGKQTFFIQLSLK